MKALEHATYLATIEWRSDMRLTVDRRIVPAMSFVDSAKLNSLIDTSIVPEVPEVDGEVDCRQMDPEARRFQSSNS
jgi:hypothetical protein